MANSRAGNEIALDPFVLTTLGEFVAIRSDDPAKSDLELTHDPCGERLCDVQDLDSMEILVQTVLGHACPEPASKEVST